MKEGSVMVGTLIESITFIHYTPTPTTMKRFTPKKIHSLNPRKKKSHSLTNHGMQLSSATRHDHFYHRDIDENK